MKLYGSPTSPYTRKVQAIGLQLGLEFEFERVDVYAMVSDFGSINPLHRIPALRLDNGEVMFDSRVICEYLIFENKSPMLAPAGPKRWETLKCQALGDGILDAAVPWFSERSRPSEQQSALRIARYERCILQGVDALEKISDQLVDMDLGTITIACALGYLDFRFQILEWRWGRSRLAAWAEAFFVHSSIAQTVPTAVARWDGEPSTG